MKTVCTRLVSWLLVCCFPMLTPAQPDKSYFTIQANDEAIAKIYAGLLDREITSALPSLNPDTGLVQVQSSMSPSLTQTANLLSALGSSYSLKQSKYHQSQELLGLIQLMFQSLQKADVPDDEAAIVVEAEMSAFISVQDSLRSSERIKTVQSINTRLDQLLAKEPGYDDSRGMVWCGVMAMASRFNGSTKYQDAAARKLKSIHSILFKTDGQVLENGTFDLTRSLRSLQYLFLYRVMSGEAKWDESIQRSLIWATQLHSFHGHPLAVSRSPKQFDSSVYANIMSALTYYGDHDSAFIQTATRYLESLIAAIPGYALRHNINHFLRGMRYHTKPDALSDIPYEGYSQLYQADHALYYTVGKHYQTFITLASPLYHHGLQTWSYKGQPPVVIPQPKLPSGLKSYGIDSSETGVDTDDPSTYRFQPLTIDVQTLMYNQNGLLCAYVFSPDITTVIYRDLNSSGNVEWVISKPAGAQMSHVEHTAVQFANTEAQLFMPPIEPQLIQKDDSLTLRFPYRSEMVWFTFAGPQSLAVIQPVNTGVVLLQLNENGTKINIVLNLDTNPFQTEMNFPGTKIPVPQLPALGSQWLDL